MGRKPDPRFTFGDHQYSCLGRRLAELEIEVGIRMALSRLLGLHWGRRSQARRSTGGIVHKLETECVYASSS